MTTPTPPGDQNSGFGQQPQGQPYGQQPPAQPYGTPPQGQPFDAQAQGAPQAGYQPGQPQFGAPPATPAPKKQGVGKRLLGTVVALVVVLGVGLGLNALRVNSGPKVGTCVTASGSSSNAKTKKIDCGDTSTFSYEVTAKQDSGSCGEYYSSLTLTSRGNKKVYCLMPNLAEGKCYSEVSGNEGFKVVECTGTYDVKVDKRINGVSDESQCDAKVSAGFLKYDKEPKRTYCLSQK